MPVKFCNTLISALLASAALPSVMPAIVTPTAYAQSQALENIVVVSQKTAAADIAGSVTFIGAEELAKQDYTDVTRVLRAVPGINLQEEDGYGLRPNIGMRGSGADRSSKVVIMEDGVLMAPAPYSAPAAYYFPSAARMSAIEVTKGPATVKYGPNTTAGAINLFSTPIPDIASGHLVLMASDQDRLTAHGWAGTRLDAGAFDLGVLIETYQDQADGFKSLPLQSDHRDTGFDIEDYVAKLGAYSKDGHQSFELKYQNQSETSHETYVGLIQADFDQDPNQRYAASALDNFKGEHTLYQATHYIKLTQDWSLTTLAYRTEFARNWKKLDKFDNSAASGLSGCDSIDEILREPELCAQEMDVLRGEYGYTSADDVLGIRENNRSYYAQGIQMGLGGVISHGDYTHNLSLSARYHEDGVDRFQQQDQYKIHNGVLIKTTDNQVGSQANRLSGARALSAYIEDRLVHGGLTVTAGLRVEDVDSQQDRWDTPDRYLAPSSQRKNRYAEVLPSLAGLYTLNSDMAVYGGVHRGFSAAPVSSQQSTDPEESTVYEGGVRYTGANSLSLDATVFANDYANLLGECTNSTGGSDCDIGDAFNAGEVLVKGLEVSANYDAALLMDTWLALPVSLTYSYTDTKIENSFSNSFWGDVTAGDQLPYVPTHQLTVSAGIEADRWSVNAVVSGVSEARNVAGKGPIDKDNRIDGRALLDVSAHYSLTETSRLKFKAENLADEIYVAARRPYGLRPGKPREIFVGIAVDF